MGTPAEGGAAGMSAEPSRVETEGLKTPEPLSSQTLTREKLR